MNKLDKCIKSFNIPLTNTLEREDFFRIDYNQDRISINYSECISLYDLIVSFNKLYLLFKNDYKKLEKLDFGKKINVLNYTNIKDELRVLELLVYKPSVVNDNYTHLYLREINGVSMPYISNDIGSIHCDDYYKKNVKIPAKVVKSYLDLFDKYELLFKICKRLKNNLVFNDEIILLHTRIESNEANFLDEMESFIVSLHSNSDGNHIDIAVNLGNELNINIDNSLIYIDGEDIKLSNELCIEVLKKIFIYSNYLERNRKDNSKIKVLKNI